MLLLAVLGALSALTAGWGLLPELTPERKLIEFGWDEPSTAFLRQHIREMERMPFDGVVLNARFTGTDGREQVLNWKAFGRQAIPWSALEPALSDLEATRFRRFTDNFLRMNVTPGDVGWFGDFTPVIHNARMTARLVRRGGLAGILFDVEQYEGRLFSYNDQSGREPRPPEAYLAQVRRRGREVMRAFQAEAPGLTVFLTFGYNLPGLYPDSYGLLAAFLDGLFEEAAGGTRIVDGFEFSYPYRSSEEFERGYRKMVVTGRRLSAVPGAYRARLSAGFGIWLDWNWRFEGWSTQDFAANYFTPQALEASLTAALRRSDRYVWLYSEQPRWWPRARLPEAYIASVRRARARLGMANP
jgi:hypothetical protein